MKPVLKSSDTHVAFSAIFPGFDKDESRYINQVSNHLAISNYTTSPAAADFISDLEKLFYHQEEPFQSASIYAQFKVYELAKNNGITVLLDGQGSDEILGGYHKYYHWYWQELLAAHKLKEVKNEIRAATSLGVKASWNLTNYIAAYLPAITAKQLEAKARRQQASHPDITVDFLRQNRNKNSTYKPPVDKLNDILYFNTVQFGLQELLRYADRNSMAFSREVRLPFLNHELVQFIFSLPSSFKIKNGWTKWILRQTMQGILPDEIVWRKDKIGFEPPQQLWMQHETIQDRIHESRRKLVKEGILKKEVLSKPVRAQHPHEPRNFDWRYLCAANCI
jgi:asparagine synthase (glutamine-hydrolysing)